MDNRESPINGQAVRARCDYTLWTIVLGHSFVMRVGEDSRGTRMWPDPEPKGTIVPKHRSLIYTVRPRGRLQGPIGHGDSTTRYLPGRLLPETWSSRNRRARVIAEFRQEVLLFAPITGLQIDTILYASTFHRGAIRWQYLRHTGLWSLWSVSLSQLLCKSAFNHWMP